MLETLLEMNITTIVPLAFQNSLGEYIYINNFYFIYIFNLFSFIFIFSLQPYNHKFLKSSNVVKNFKKIIHHIIANRYLCIYIGTNK